MVVLKNIWNKIMSLCLFELCYKTMFVFCCFTLHVYICVLSPIFGIINCTVGWMATYESNSHLRIVTGLVHVWPQPLEQHLWSSSQSISLLHSSTQLPSIPSVDGHIPGFGAWQFKITYWVNQSLTLVLRRGVATTKKKQTNKQTNKQKQFSPGAQECAAKLWNCSGYL